MKSTRVMITLATLLVANIAAAQMMGGGNGSHHGTPPSNGGSTSGGMNGGGMNGSGNNGGGMMGGMGSGMGQSLIVDKDGVAYTLRTSTTPTQASPYVDVIAIRPAGTVAWARRVDGWMTRLELSGNLVLVASGSGDMGMDGNLTDDDEASVLYALSAASGEVQWKVDLEGLVMSIEPFPGGTYVVAVKHDRDDAGSGMHNGSNGTMSMDRSIAAIDNDGKLLWSLDLN